MAVSDLDARSNERRALLIVAGAAVPPGVVAGLIALLGGPVAALVVLVVVAGGVAAWLWLGADARVARLIGGSDADPLVHARLVNMVEGVSVGVGVTPPRLVVLDDPACNTLVAGRDPRRAVLAVTSGLLGELSPIELEGVVAEQLVRIRRRDALPASLALPLGAAGRRLAGGRDDTAADLLAVSVTRYPPGLASAMETMARAGTALATAPRALAPLWLAEQSPGEAHLGLAERAEALRDL